MAHVAWLLSDIEEWQRQVIATANSANDACGDPRNDIPTWRTNRRDEPALPGVFQKAGHNPCCAENGMNAPTDSGCDAGRPPDGKSLSALVPDEWLEDIVQRPSHVKNEDKDGAGLSAGGILSPHRAGANVAVLPR